MGYVLDNNLYVADLETGTVRSVTTDGSPDILNGVFDYVTAQAFRNANGWHWSPDGRKIAFWRLDIAHMRVFYIVDELSKYNRVLPLKYSEVGERSALLRVGVADVDTGNTTWMDAGDEIDVYIPRIGWTNSSKTLTIQRLNRSHKKLELLFGDVETGETRVVVTDTDPSWVDVTNDLIFFTEQDRFVWTSEKSGYRHAYLYDYDGKVITQLTRGDWEISSLAALDDEGGWLYFYGKKDSFIDQHVYRVRLDGTDFDKASQEPGWYEWNVSPDGKTVIESFSDARTLPRVTLREANGRQLRVLQQNRIEALGKYRMPHPEFVTVTTSDGAVLNAYMIKPSDFDPNKKYPVVAYGYGNAGSQVVVNQWEDTRGLWHRYMADKGYIVFALDNRTTAGRGKAARNLTYGHYAKWALHDQLEGVKYLKSLPYVDDSRLGFWGWSGGGYLACLLMTKGAPHFKTAVSVAPVIDLERYMSIGVERWMGSLEDNEEGYASTNLLNYADKLQGNLLLVHGTGDENVKFAFTLQFANALIAENKQFDMMVYPNRHHGIRDARLHLFTKIANYFFKNL